jgi:hypothetical protein
MINPIFLILSFLNIDRAPSGKDSAGPVLFLTPAYLGLFYRPTLAIFGPATKIILALTHPSS